MEEHIGLEYTREELLQILPQEMVDDSDVESLVKNICESQNINFDKVIRYYKSTDGCAFFSPKLIIEYKE